MDPGRATQKRLSEARARPIAAPIRPSTWRQRRSRARLCDRAAAPARGSQGRSVQPCPSRPRHGRRFGPDPDREVAGGVSLGTGERLPAAHAFQQRVSFGDAGELRPANSVGAAASSPTRWPPTRKRRARRAATATPPIGGSGRPITPRGMGLRRLSCVIVAREREPDTPLLPRPSESAKAAANHSDVSRTCPFSVSDRRHRTFGSASPFHHPLSTCPSPLKSSICLSFIASAWPSQNMTLTRPRLRSAGVDR